MITKVSLTVSPNALRRSTKLKIRVQCWVFNKLFSPSVRLLSDNIIKHLESQGYSSQSSKSNNKDTE